MLVDFRVKNLCALDSYLLLARSWRAAYLALLWVIFAVNGFSVCRAFSLFVLNTLDFREKLPWLVVSWQLSWPSWLFQSSTVPLCFYVCVACDFLLYILLNVPYNFLCVLGVKKNWHAKNFISLWWNLMFTLEKQRGRLANVYGTWTTSWHYYPKARVGRTWNNNDIVSHANYIQQNIQLCYLWANLL